jgi:hypothetical protein
MFQICTPAVIEMWNERILNSLIDHNVHSLYVDMIHVTWKYKLKLFLNDKLQILFRCMSIHLLRLMFLINL